MDLVTETAVAAVPRPAMSRAVYQLRKINDVAVSPDGCRRWHSAPWPVMSIYERSRQPALGSLW
ncbi:hypothetical protein I5Q34_00405 [Streptomyces sp. AV19]|nr:hypothetical protein [Streptomyces sp. AV19]